jgi:hypothetical protein
MVFKTMGNKLVNGFHSETINWKKKDTINVFHNEMVNWENKTWFSKPQEASNKWF